MDTLQKFNTTFIEFVDDLIRVAPNDADFQVYGMLMKSAIQARPNCMVHFFRESVSIPYEDAILNRNEDFFVNHTFNDVTEGSKEATSLMNRIKSYWKDMSHEDKDIIWRYFRVLVLLERKLRT